MIKVYAITLAISVIGLIVLIIGSALSSNTDGKVRDPGDSIGGRGKVIFGAVLGFSMAGMAAEYSPLDLSWQVALLIALLGLVSGAFWTRYAIRQADS